MKISRKKFFTNCLKGAAFIAIPSLFTALIESCSSNSSNPVSGSSSFSSLDIMQVVPNNNVISLNIDSSSPLNSVGGALLIESSNSNILVDRSDQSTYNALSAICTHQGCLITIFDSTNHQFLCSCHGSKFDFNGKVVNGPAAKSLPVYPIQLNDNKITITI